ncbi:unnamed protein product [Penicillium bialowiezense]
MGLFKRQRPRSPPPPPPPPRPRAMYRYDWQTMSNGHDTIQCDRASQVISADYAMREQVQREETLSYRAAASRKATAIEDDQSQSKEEDEMLEQARKQRSKKERALYHAVSLFDQKNKDTYDALRCDPAWYMNEGLIQDCSDQDGCCSRQCGCCKKRHLTGPAKGIGHCTSECWCYKGLIFSINLPLVYRNDAHTNFFMSWRAGAAFDDLESFELGQIERKQPLPVRILAPASSMGFPQAIPPAKIRLPGPQDFVKKG